MKRFFRHILDNSYLYLILTGFTWLFFFRFDYSTLGSWDEAWYGSIAREIVRSGEWIKLVWNGKPYYDHPPMGFWIIAISYKIFGISEFSTRLFSVLAGIMSTFFIYHIGHILSKKKTVGAASAIILGTCVWYLIRVRSGNLDGLFVMWYLATIYFTLLARKTIQYILLSAVCAGCLMLTKTLVGASIFPLLLYLLAPQILKIKKNIGWVIVSVLLFIIVVLPWYWINYFAYSDFWQHHFITIGMRERNSGSFLHLSPQLPLFYLHMGIRKWYYLWILSVVYLLVFFRWLKWQVQFLLLWNLIVLYPFLTTELTQLWHLIPVYVPVALVTSYALSDLCDTFGGFVINNVLRIFRHAAFKRIKQYERGIAQFVFFVCIMMLAVIQIRIFIPEVYPQTRFIPDDVDISMKVARYPETIFLDDDYLPLAVYYSGRTLHQLSWEPDERKTLVKLFQSGEQHFVVITRNWALNNLKEQAISYKILNQNTSFSIVSR